MVFQKVLRSGIQMEFKFRDSVPLFRGHRYNIVHMNGRTSKKKWQMFLDLPVIPSVGSRSMTPKKWLKWEIPYG